ncbi:lectin-like [Hemitrygon akajei]|uniref:lectin-like n=1 Tax=Hemitrygon akajei TaxID=2704970 RepID=UPI003BF9D85A
MAAYPSLEDEIEKEFDCSAEDETEKANSSENKTPKKSSHDAQIFQTPCLVGWVYNRDLSTCYRYYHTKKNWIQAEIYCQMYAPGGHLASIHREEHNQFIQDLIKRNNPAQTSTWIGLSDCHKEGVYLWTDGSATGFTKWKHDRPKGKEERENCVITNSEGIGGTWDDRVCSDELPFVCGYKLL